MKKNLSQDSNKDKCYMYWWVKKKQLSDCHNIWICTKDYCYAFPYVVTGMCPVWILAGSLTHLTGIFHNLLQSVQMNVGIVHYNRPQPLPFKSLSTNNPQSSSHFIWHNQSSMSRRHRRQRQRQTEDACMRVCVKARLYYNNVKFHIRKSIGIL